MLIAGLVAASIRSSPGLVVNARSISHAATLSNLQETAIEFSTATATTMYTEELDAVCEWEADCKVEDEWDEDCKDEDCEDDYELEEDREEEDEEEEYEYEYYYCEDDEEDCDEVDEDEVDWDEEKEEDYCEEDDCEEDYEEEDYEEEDYEEHKEYDWTPVQVEEMKALYERYRELLAEQYGPDWEEEYELTEDMDVIYERYLDFEEQNQHHEPLDQDAMDERNRDSDRALRTHEDEKRIEKGYYSLDDADHEADLYKYDSSAAASVTGDEFIPQHNSFFLDREWSDFNKVGGDKSFRDGPYPNNGTQTAVSWTEEGKPYRRTFVITTTMSNDRGEQSWPTTIVTTRRRSARSVAGSV